MSKDDDKRKDELNAAIEAGKQAYRDAVGGANGNDDASKSTPQEKSGAEKLHLSDKAKQFLLSAESSRIGQKSIYADETAPSIFVSHQGKQEIFSEIRKKVQPTGAARFENIINILDQVIPEGVPVEMRSYHLNKAIREVSEGSQPLETNADSFLSKIAFERTREHLDKLAEKPITYSTPQQQPAAATEEKSEGGWRENLRNNKGAAIGGAAAIAAGTVLLGAGLKSGQAPDASLTEDNGTQPEQPAKSGGFKKVATIALGAVATLVGVGLALHAGRGGNAAMPEGMNKVKFAFMGAGKSR
jgi:hypothetical protein